MVTGTIPFKAKSIPELHKLIIESDFTFPDSIKLSVEFKDLIRYYLLSQRQILVKDPSKRITIEKIWSHPWLKDSQKVRKDNSISDIETVNNAILDSIVHKLESYGFNHQMINDTLTGSLMNHLSATYLLLLQKHFH